jgi:hypothetical protein
MVGTLEFMSPEVGFNPIPYANYYCTTHMQRVKYKYDVLYVHVASVTVYLQVVKCNYA